MNRVKKLLCGPSVAAALLVSVNALAGPECKPFEKQVSVDNGITWFNADDEASAPTQSLGGEVNYQFIVTNCGRAPVNSSLFKDPKLGINVTIFHESLATVGATLTFTKNIKGLENLPFTCEESGLVVNEALTNSYYTDPVTGDETDTEINYDRAYVICGNPVIGRLGDYVWEDLNANGIQDAGEPGISGVVVDLYDAGANGVCDSTSADDSFLDTTSTDSDGYYLFDNLNAANYCVVFPEAAAALDCSSKDGNRGVAVYTSTTVGDDTAVDSNAFLTARRP